MTPAPIRIQQLPPPLPNGPEPLEVIEVPMTSFERQRVRRRLTTTDGRELILELPTGTVLPVGQPLHLEGRTAYVVHAAPEEVLVIEPRSLAEAAFVGHLIGNLHRDIVREHDRILALWDAPLERRLRQAEVPVRREQRPFGGRPAGEHRH